MALPALLRELLRAPGPVGHEEAVQAIVRREAAALGAEVEGDVLGSTVARIRGTGGGRCLAVFAHADQIGMIASRVDDEGLVHVRPLGSWSAVAALGHRVVFLRRGEPVPGVVTRAGAGAEPAWGDLRVDVGASTPAEALALVAPGDAGVLDAPPLELAGGRFTGGALDNRLGLYAALVALERLAADPPAWDVALVASAQEEGGAGGAAAVAGRLRPDAALAVDITYAADDPAQVPAAWGDVRLGGGPTVFRGGVVNPLLVERLLDAAELAGVGVGVEAGRETRTDVDAVHSAAGGIAVCLLGIPIRASHTAAEVGQLSDVDGAAVVVQALARALEPGASFVR